MMTLPVDSNNDILSLVYSLKSIINNFETKDIDESNKNIILNARGFKFKVIPYKFDKFPRSRLAKIFERLKRKNKSELLKFCDDISPDFNEIYFDRDPFFFNKILNAYQTGKLHFDNSECINYIRDELEYWQIEEWAFDDCCKISYFTKCEDVEETIENEIAMRDLINHKEDFGSKYFPEVREKLWNLFENPYSSIYARIIFYFTIFLIIVSVVAISNYSIFIEILITYMLILLI
jgi:potassium voltage-gated channel Shaw-related subfamily C member 1